MPTSQQIKDSYAYIRESSHGRPYNMQEMWMLFILEIVERQKHANAQ
jgi:hypothetical protein